MAELEARWKQVKEDLDGDMECVDAVVGAKPLNWCSVLFINGHRGL